MFTQGLLRNQPADLWKGHICSISIESVESVVGEIGCATIIERIAWISLDEVLEKIEEVLACDVEVVLVEPPIYASVLSVLDVLDEYSFVCCEDGTCLPRQQSSTSRDSSRLVDRQSRSQLCRCFEEEFPLDQVSACLLEHLQNRSSMIHDLGSWPRRRIAMSGQNL
jgi:hypothetical protein